MIRWCLLKKHLNRSVKIAHITNFSDFKKISQISSSVILLCFGDIKHSKSDLHNFYETLSSCFPLTITIVGKDSRENFNELLNITSKYSYINNRHIMTSFDEENKVSEWISDILYPIYPSEERFDEWKEHRILVIGDNSFFKKIYKAFESKLNK